MEQHYKKSKWFAATAVAVVSLLTIAGLQAGVQPVTVFAASTAQAESSQSATSIFPATLKLSTDKGQVGSTIDFSVSGLQPNKDVQLMWNTESGSYKIKGIYTFESPIYKPVEQAILKGTSDANGVWKSSFTIPKGFGGNHTLYLTQGGKEMTQANMYVAPSFQISPTSGPVGTPITIKAEGLGATEMDSNWQLTYDNKMTGLISAVSTDGSAIAKIRAAGAVGSHTITIWHGYMGMPYLNYTEAPTAYLPVPTFSFQVTKDQPVSSYVEDVPPTAANGGVKMPALKQQTGVKVSLNKASGTVGQPVTLTATGLPTNQKVDLIWNSMSGSRVSGSGFQSVQSTLGEATTDGNGDLQFNFPIPDDLGGVPHRIDLKINGKIYGQAYLRILPSIVEVTPTSGKAGTKVTVELKGVGWTEFDNTYYITYDNAYVGYVCGFNSRGTVKFTLTASGAPGYHLIDLYPGIYRGTKPRPNIYNAPQLTYFTDHPGDALPAIRLGFNITQ